MQFRLVVGLPAAAAAQLLKTERARGAIKGRLHFTVLSPNTAHGEVSPFLHLP
jgi:hypothetical protein